MVPMLPAIKRVREPISFLELERVNAPRPKIRQPMNEPRVFYVVTSNSVDVCSVPPAHLGHTPNFLRYSTGNEEVPGRNDSLYS